VTGLLISRFFFVTFKEFHQLKEPVMTSPRHALKQYFGFDQFRPGQEEAIQRILAGQSTLLVMPTGAGKSLTYQLPALLKPGLTLIISPLIALMKDQVDQLTELGLPVTFINSALPNYEINQRLRAVREGHVKLLYIAPERLRNRAFTASLAKTKISLLAVDEAHCVSQWGHDFRPDYLQIGPIWQAMGRPPLLATTATATPKVQRDIINLLDLPKGTRPIVTGFNRPNLSLRVLHLPDSRVKLQTLADLLPSINGQVIVYTATRRNTDEVANFIRARLGLLAEAYHAGLDHETRHRVQTAFMTDKIPIIVATNAFGMGVDKPDVRAVIHYNMPANVEAYYQEAGRAGRDGLPADCILLYAADDQRLQHFLITNDTPTAEDLRLVYAQLQRSADNQGEIYFTLPELAQIVGLYPVKLRVVLSELELANALLHLGHQNGYHQWRILPLTDTALHRRVEAIKCRTQIRLDLLEAMLNYVHLTRCRRRYMLDYFGDESPPKAPNCCDNHAADSVSSLPKAVTPQEWAPLVVLETVRTLSRPVGRKRLVQILLGSQARQLQAMGYDRHKFFGKLSLLNRSEVTVLVDNLLRLRYLRLSGGEMPVLSLTPAGQQALEDRVALPITLPDMPAPKNGNLGRQDNGRPRSNTVALTYDLFQSGLTPAQIAHERSLSEDTIYNHLSRLIDAKQILLPQVVSPETEAKILAAVETIGSSASLTPLKAVLPESISFGQIKCVLTAHPQLPKNNLSQNKPQTLVQRIVALGESKDLKAIPDLINALGHTDGNVRRLAASALGKLGAQQAIPALLDLLEVETKPQVRQYAIKALGSIGDPVALPALEQIAANSGENDYNLKAAKTALTKLKNRPSNPPDLQSSSLMTSPSIGCEKPSDLDLPPATPTILDAVASLGGQLGRTGLVQFLSGSQAAWLVAFREHSAYGRLSHLSQKAILICLDHLIEQGQLLVTGGARPKLILPPDQEAGRPLNP
jgi:ATP-dependent DNA helicase RecQ